MNLSIVTTLYKSSATVEEFYRRAVAAAETLTRDFEIVMVDDGSPDNSLAIACEIAQRDERVRVVELSRNFGHHKALMTGLEHAEGELCFLLDSDLEEDPALLRDFHQRLEAADADVIYGYQDEAQRGRCGEGDGRYRVSPVQPADFVSGTPKPYYRAPHAPELCRRPPAASGTASGHRRPLGHHRIQANRNRRQQAVASGIDLQLMAPLAHADRQHHLVQRGAIDRHFLSGACRFISFRADRHRPGGPQVVPGSSPCRDGSP